MLRSVLSAIAIVSVFSVGCSSQEDAQSSLAGRQPRPSALMKRIAKVDCVKAVERELEFSINSSTARATGNLIITMNDDAIPYLCSTALVEQVKGLQLLSVMSNIQVILAKGKATTARLPRDLKKQLSGVDCVVAVEEEFVASIPESSEQLPVTGNFLVTIADEFTAYLCAENIYKKIPGAQIDSQSGATFRVIGRK
jgi:hypothetical protein